MCDLNKTKQNKIFVTHTVRKSSLKREDQSSLYFSRVCESETQKMKFTRGLKTKIREQASIRLCLTPVNIHTVLI